MAKQHLYSRVPARLSMYNRTDGYDTFACSSGLERTYIDDEISKVYDNKPTKNDALLIQDGKLPPVYCQRTGENGELIQSCVSYLTQDYTGERSSYMVHSLVIDGEERDALISNPSNKTLNPDMFMTTVSTEDLTSLNSPFNDDYPEIAYKNVDGEPTAELLKKYSPERLRNLIYAFLSVASGKTKGVFITFKASATELSGVCLDFLNTFIQIFPYHIRPVLSFVTYAGDITKYTSFRIRCMPGNLRDIPTVKGMSVNFAANETTGISEDMMNTNSAVVNFFYGLIENDAVRREFLRFADEAVSKVPALAKPTLSNVSDMVLLFQQCSGLYSDAAILPNDDRVYDFVSTYEKFRDALSDEFRAAAFRFLSRYPQKRVAIPKNVFSKISSIYPKEPVASKRVIMNTVLDFIHTDVMRDKLFTFMKNNYDGEDETTKAEIIEDLSRVYYGGFLQSQILTFFDGCFSEAPEKSKDLIVEKLLLTLRTKNVQGQVTEILDKHYSELTADEKNSFYEEFYKTLPDGDALAEKLTDIVDRNIAIEDESFKAEVAKRICTITENDQRRKEPHIIPVMAERDGFCSDSVMHRLFFEWSGRKAFSEYWAVLWQRPFGDRIGKIISVFRSFPDIPDETVDRMSSCVKEQFEASTGRYGLNVVTDAYMRLKNELPDRAKKFSDEICESYLLPMICKSLPDAFSVANGVCGVSRAEQFAKEYPELTSRAEYGVIDSYVKLREALISTDLKTAVESSAELKNPSVRSKAADALDNEAIRSGVLSDEKHDGARMMAFILKGMMKDTFKASECYRNERQIIEKRLMSSSQDADMDIAKAADACAMNSFIEAGAVLYSTDVYKTEREKFFGAESDISVIFSDYCDVNGKNGRNTIDEKIKSLPSELNEYRDALNSALGTVKSSGGGFFKRLFGKK